MSWKTILLLLIFCLSIFALNCQGPNCNINQGGGGFCVTCNQLATRPSAQLFTLVDDANSNLTIIGYYENISLSPPRQPLANVILIVEVSNSTGIYEVYKTYTDESGKAAFDFKKWNGACASFKVLYCPYCLPSDLACQGFQDCLNYSGIGDTKSLAAFFDSKAPPYYSSADISSAPGQTIPSDNKLSSLKYLPQVDYASYCAPPKGIPSTPGICLPLLLIFSLLGGALYYTGRNPFAGFNIGSTRVGQHLKFQPRGRSFSISGAAVISAISSIAGTAKTAAKEGASGVAKQEKAQAMQTGGFFVTGATGEALSGKGAKSALGIGDSASKGVGGKVGGAPGQKGTNIGIPMGGKGGTQFSQSAGNYSISAAQAYRPRQAGESAAKYAGNLIGRFLIVALSRTALGGLISNLGFRFAGKNWFGDMLGGGSKTNVSAERAALEAKLRAGDKALFDKNGMLLEVPGKTVTKPVSKTMESVETIPSKLVSVSFKYVDAQTNTVTNPNSDKIVKAVYTVFDQATKNSNTFEVDTKSGKVSVGDPFSPLRVPEAQQIYQAYTAKATDISANVGRIIAATEGVKGELAAKLLELVKRSESKPAQEFVAQLSKDQATSALETLGIKLNGKTDPVAQLHAVVTAWHAVNTEKNIPLTPTKIVTVVSQSKDEDGTQTYIIKVQSVKDKFKFDEIKVTVDSSHAIKPESSVVLSKTDVTKVMTQALYLFEHSSRPADLSQFEASLKKEGATVEVVKLATAAFATAYPSTSKDPSATEFSRKDFEYKFGVATNTDQLTHAAATRVETITDPNEERAHAQAVMQLLLKASTEAQGSIEPKGDVFKNKDVPDQLKDVLRQYKALDTTEIPLKNIVGDPSYGEGVMRTGQIDKVGELLATHQQYVDRQYDVDLAVYAHASKLINDKEYFKMCKGIDMLNESSAIGANKDSILNATYSELNENQKQFLNKYNPRDVSDENVASYGKDEDESNAKIAVRMTQMSTDLTKIERKLSEQGYAIIDEVKFDITKRTGIKVVNINEEQLKREFEQNATAFNLAKADFEQAKASGPAKFEGTKTVKEEAPVEKEAPVREKKSPEEKPVAEKPARRFRRSSKDDDDDKA